MIIFVKEHFPIYYDQVYTKLISSWSNDPNNPFYINQAKGFIDELLQIKMNIPTVGASGAVYGVLLAFGVLFPNTELILIFFPFMPIKAKYMVIGMGLIELFYGLSQTDSNIAHFAHLGGMIFGFILIKYWNKTKEPSKTTARRLIKTGNNTPFFSDLISKTSGVTDILLSVVILFICSNISF